MLAQSYLNNVSMLSWVKYFLCELVRNQGSPVTPMYLSAECSIENQLHQQYIIQLIKLKLQAFEKHENEHLILLWFLEEK